MAFSLQRPFGVQLYPMFESAYHALTGKSTDVFDFNVPGLFGNNITDVTLVIVSYLTIIFAIQAWMVSRKRFDLKPAFCVHNLFLSLGSLVLFALYVEKLLPMIVQHGFYYSICSQDAFTNNLAALHYVNYLFKLYELSDTIFLVLTKRSLRFIHYYHHSLTFALCYVQLVGKTSVSYMPIVINLFIHVFMYSYYLMKALGRTVWWKQYLTSMQIVQFIVDLGVVYYCAYNNLAFNYAPFMPTSGDCAGTVAAGIFGVGSLTSYLILFTKLYNDLYQKPQVTVTKNDAVAKPKKI